MEENAFEPIIINNQHYGENGPLGFILGPCVIESLDQCVEIVSTLQDQLSFPFIFKGSFDKANRSSIDSFRGLGLDKGLEILQTIKAKFNIAVTTDLHLPSQVEKASKVCDILQIPAFLARQTDLLVEAAKTMLPIHVKKGQFMAPADMEHVSKKISSTGNKKIIFTERGSSFGYHNLVNDFRSFPMMKEFCSATCYDVTHSGQLPGQGKISGGQRAFMEPLAYAAVSAGADLIFLETHPNPEKALSDSATQFPLSKIAPFLKKLQRLHSFHLEEKTINV